jgi:peptidoglycan hydrolase CwlO-like protein
MMDELLGRVNYGDIILLLLIVFSLVSVYVVRQNIKKEMEETEEKIADLQRYQGQVSEGLDSKFASLKDDIDDTSNKVIVRINELLKKLNTTLSESKKGVMFEVENRINTMKASLNETQGSIRKSLMENEKEMKRLSQELEDFSKEIQRMKDDIRERSIDLEL